MNSSTDTAWPVKRDRDLAGREAAKLLGNALQPGNDVARQSLGLILERRRIADGAASGIAAVLGYDCGGAGFGFLEEAPDDAAECSADYGADRATKLTPASGRSSQTTPLSLYPGAQRIANCSHAAMNSRVIS